MKKLSLLIAMILVVTIGGVYANWIYAGTQADPLHHHIANLSLTDPSTSTKYGKYEVLTGDDTIKIKFDQRDQTPGSFDYTADLIFIGSMKITFTPDPAFDGTPVAKFKLSYENTGLMDIKFNDYLYGKTDGKTNVEKAIFTKFDTGTEIDLAFVKDDSLGVWEATIDATQLDALIDINTFILDTKAGYDAFAAVVNTFGRIGIDVIDYSIDQ